METLRIFDSLKSLPMGTRLFSSIVCFKAPYFGTISPKITVLQPSFAQAQVRKNRKVCNHLGTIHAIAMCNLAELVGGLMTDVSIPQSKRWIPKGMTVQYVKKAKTDIFAVADGKGIKWDTDGEVVVPVTIKDVHDTTVFTAKITMQISTKQNKKTDIS